MILKALSIRQPWVELILSGRKTLEVRRWKRQVSHRGPFFIHASSTLDWRAIELFNFKEPLALPRGGIVGYAEVESIHPLDREFWLGHLEEHFVIHERQGGQEALQLKNIRRFPRVIRCGGEKRFFDLRESIAKRANELLEEST